jgi:3-oxoacyl-[acyl-carrier protein] reductase
MDLGIRGKWAVVCASSKGLGLGCAQALAAEGVNLVLNARGAPLLAQQAQRLRVQYGVEVKEVAADVTTSTGRAALLSAAPVVDILVNNAGGPPPGDFRQFERDDWIKALDANMLTPIELIKATIDGMVERGFGRIVNITSSAVKAPIDILGLSNGARSGLTGFTAGIARSYAQYNVTINGLLPGLFDTDRIAQTMQGVAQKQNKTVEEVVNLRRLAIPAKRLGTIDEFGAACAFICSVQAGYFTGQNFLLDGGAYPGTF